MKFIVYIFESTFISKTYCKRIITDIAFAKYSLQPLIMILLMKNIVNESVDKPSLSSVKLSFAHFRELNVSYLSKNVFVKLYIF